MREVQLQAECTERELELVKLHHRTDQSIENYINEHQEEYNEVCQNSKIEMDDEVHRLMIGFGNTQISGMTRLSSCMVSVGDPCYGPMDAKFIYKSIRPEPIRTTRWDNRGCGNTVNDAVQQEAAQPIR